MPSIDLWMSLIVWLLITGGKGLYIASFASLHIPLLGHGCRGVGEWNCRNFVNLFGQSMTMLACVLVAHEPFMKGWRYFRFKFMNLFSYPKRSSRLSDFIHPCSDFVCHITGSCNNWSDAGISRLLSWRGWEKTWSASSSSPKIPHGCNFWRRWKLYESFLSSKW